MQKFITWFKSLKVGYKILFIVGILWVIGSIMRLSGYKPTHDSPVGNTYLTPDDRTAYNFGNMSGQSKDDVRYNKQYYDANGNPTRHVWKEGKFTYDNNVIKCTFNDGDSWTLNYVNDELIDNNGDTLHINNN